MAILILSSTDNCTRLTQFLTADSIVSEDPDNTPACISTDLVLS